MTTNPGVDGGVAVDGVEDEAVTDPVGLVVRLVATVERHLDAVQIRQIVTQVVGSRAGRRRLAKGLRQHPEVLRTGRPSATWSAAQLLLGLREAGAREVAVPRCAGCDQPTRYLHSRRGGSWGCSGCFDPRERCAGCGNHRRVVSRDRRGQPRCGHCPDTDGDAPQQLARLVTRLEPALRAEAVLAALGRATVKAAGQHRLAWAVLRQPDLLTGNGHLAPAPAVLRFIDELVASGATMVTPPGCPRCHRVVALSKLLEGVRICRACFARAAAVPCVRCRAVRQPAARDPDGGPLCPNCLVSDPANLEECVGCGHRSRVAVRAADGPRCVNCRPRTTATCAICGRNAVCEVSRATGQPWCERCQQWWAPCSTCQAVAPVRGGTRAAPLCARCVNPDPAFWDRCPVCQVAWQTGSRPCARCNLARHVRDLLSDGPTGQVRADLAALQQAITGVPRPPTALAWLTRPKIHALLTRIAGDQQPVTHELLDALPGGKTREHLRSVLVATGTLPERDEHLHRLQQWTSTLIQQRTDATHRRLLHAYGVWHHLRRLRHRTRGRRLITDLQALNVRCHLRAAAGFLDWLAGNDLTLADCTQADLDRWAATPNVSYRDETSHFVRWAVEHRHAARLTFPARRWDGPVGPHNPQRRWGIARRLLHDATLATPDRVAGLLLVLFAQKLATITRLTVDQVHATGDRVELRVGAAPIVLPDPLAALVTELVATRRSHLAIGAQTTGPWLFPGGRPGHPITITRLSQRLQRLGLRPGRDRATALFALATELPAAVLARMLGLHVAVAVAWQRAASGDWTRYAAEVSRRTPRPTP